MKTRIGLLFIPALILALLAGCAGEKGDTGKQGPAGNTTSISQSTLRADIYSVVIDGAGHPVVTFTMTDQDGLPWSGLKSGTVSFDIAKLVAATGGNSSYWQNYVNRTETIKAGSWPNPAGTTATQGTTESNGTLTYANGFYTYTFATSLTTGNSVTYEPTLTHRLGMELRGAPTILNVAYDFIPAGGVVSSQRKIVMTQTCNQCHGTLRLHGANGERYDTNYCVTCHNPKTADANSGNTVDFKVMIHKIHFGEDLPSVLPASNGGGAGSYTIWGFSDSKHDYSAAVFPVIVPSKPSKMKLAAGTTPSLNTFPRCTKCHVESTEAPDWANWKNVPTKEACTSCHDNIVFSSAEVTGYKVLHSGGALADNAGCAGCHASTSSTAPVDTKHAYPADQDTEAAKYKFNIVKVENTKVGEFPKVTVSVTDPTNSDAKYDLAAANGPWVQGSASRLYVDVAWGQTGTIDYVNQFSGNSDPGSMVSIPVVNSGAVDSGVTKNADGTYTVTSKVAVPSDANLTLTVAVEGHPAKSFYTGSDGKPTYQRVAVAGVVEYYATSGTKVYPRRAVAQIDACNKCHDNLSIHGNNRQGTLQLCVICHNPNNSDLTRRTAKAPTGTRDGLKEQAVDFKYMIHGIHAGAKTSLDKVTAYEGIRVNGLLIGSATSGDGFSNVVFPGVINNCATCHGPVTYKLPVPFTTAGMSVDIVPDSANAYEATNHTFTSAEVDATANTIKFTGHSYNNSVASTSGVKLYFKADAGVSLPGGLTAGTAYYVVNKATDTIQVSLTQGGSAVDITDTGTASKTFTIYAASLNDPSDNKRVSPTASVCSSCHDSQTAMTHMYQNGASILVRDDINRSTVLSSLATQAELLTTKNTEACAVCHGPGGVVDITVMHKVH